MRGANSRGRFFALAAGISFGVWFGVVLAGARGEQAIATGTYSLPLSSGQTQSLE